MPLPSLTLADLTGRDVCSVEEVAAILGLSRGSAYQACRRGEVPALKVGARYVIPVRRLAAMLGADEATDTESADGTLTQEPA